MTDEIATTRRAVLASTVGGLAATAGCAGENLPWETERSYDRSELDALADSSVPQSEPAFPIDVPASTITDRLDRAESLLADVPAEPAIPNEAIADEVARTYQSAHSAIEELSNGEPTLDRLGSSRYVLSRAAETRSAYLAATGALDPSTIAADRRDLQTELAEFTSSWTYSGATPYEALIVHRELEDLVGSAERGAEAEAVLSADSREVPLQIGETVRHLERGHAALDDANLLRNQYLETVSSTHEYRSLYTRALHQLERHEREVEHRTIDYLRENDPGTIESPGSPESYLITELRASIERLWDGAESKRRRDRFAEALLEGAVRRAYLRGVHTAIEGIRNDEFRPPESVVGFETEFERGVRKLEDARKSSPTPIAVAISDRAAWRLEEGLQRLGDSDGDLTMIYRGYAALIVGRVLAEATPAAAAEMGRLLRGVAVE